MNQLSIFPAPPAPPPSSNTPTQRQRHQTIEEYGDWWRLQLADGAAIVAPGRILHRIDRKRVVVLRISEVHPSRPLARLDCCLLPAGEEMWAQWCPPFQLEPAPWFKRSLQSGLSNEWFEDAPHPNLAKQQKERQIYRIEYEEMNAKVYWAIREALNGTCAGFRPYLALALNEQHEFKRELNEIYETAQRYLLQLGREFDSDDFLYWFWKHLEAIAPLNPESALTE